MKSVVVVIVNYKVSDLTLNCLHSLAPEIKAIKNVHVVVVDNDSQDGSYEAISQGVADNAWSEWVTVLASDKNGGFAYGNNVGIQYAREHDFAGEYYWFLNPDTRVYPGGLSVLLDFMEANTQVGICGSAIENDDGSLWPICFRFPSIASEFERGAKLGLVTKLLSRWKVPREMGGENTQVDWLPGASFLIRDKVFSDIGLMDDGYFLYYEETDFCLNAFRSGWECWYVPASKIMHIAGASTGVTGQNTVRKPLPQYVFDSRRRYFTKNHGFIYALLADIAWISSYSMYLLRIILSGKKNDDPENLFWDSIKNSVLLNKFRS